MKLTTRQAAEKLSVSIGTVSKFIHQGKLKDISGKTSSRHEFLIDSKEVNALKKTYHNRKNSKPHTKPEINHGDYDKRFDSQPMPSGIFTRLSGIESKIDKLLKIWG